MLASGSIEGVFLMPRSRRRSVLYVPAINERALAKAATLACDAVILDLEDSVALEKKGEARIAARKAIESNMFVGKEVIVRVNGFAQDDTAPDLIVDDLTEILPAAPDAILLPKIRSVEDALRAEAALDVQGGPDDIDLWLMIETPQAVLEIAAIAATARQPNARLSCFAVGTNDLAKEMHLRLTPSRLALLQALSMSVLAARAYGLDVLDSVYSDIGNPAGFEAEALQGHGLGFDGKTLIHPSQIDATNRIFTPSDTEIAEAQAIVRAFDLPENAGRGVIRLNGQMVERLHLAIAKRTLGLT